MNDLKVFKLVNRMTLGYPTNGMVLGFKKSKLKVIRVRVNSNTAWV